MRLGVLISLILFSMSLFARTISVAELTKMNHEQLEHAVMNMSKSDFIMLYRHYNRTVFDRLARGLINSDKTYDETCYLFNRLRLLGETHHALTYNERIVIDRENKRSILAFCMWAPAFSS